MLGRNPDIHIVLTVSPIRYAKYGYHESQLSKSVLLLAADRLVREYDCVTYFPAYEIVNDELRDYRFYNSDMLHPSDQAVEYIWERLSSVYFCDDTRRFVEEWRPDSLKPSGTVLSIQTHRNTSLSYRKRKPVPGSSSVNGGGNMIENTVSEVIFSCIQVVSSL